MKPLSQLFMGFYLSKHGDPLFRNPWENSTVLLRLHHFHPLKGHILVMTATTQEQFRSWAILCCRTPKYSSVTEIYSAVFSGAAFVNSLNWRLGFHQLVKPSELICKWNKVAMLRDGYKQSEIEMSSKFGAKCLLHTTCHRSVHKLIPHQLWAKTPVSISPTFFSLLGRPCVFSLSLDSPTAPIWCLLGTGGAHFP